MDDFITSEEFLFNTKVFQKISTENVDAELILRKSTEIMKNLEILLSFYNDNSDVSRINKNAGKDFAKVSADTFEIVKKSIYYSKLTNGLFDITIAPLVKMWGVCSHNPKVISQENIDKILPLVDYNDILLDENKLKIMLNKKNQKIDLGGIAKGYIADLIIDFYKKNHVKSAIINLGGNIKVLGRKNITDLWKVGIYKPIKHSMDIICSLDIENLSIVTSGIYERAFINNNTLYHHILNPYTGYPAKTDIASITIVNKSSLLCDGIATPLLIMGSLKASQFMKNHNVEGILITTNNKIIISKGLLNKFKLHDNYEVLCF